MNFNILIVDDSEIMRAMLKKVIAMSDAPVKEIYEATNGVEGLKVLEDELVDVVLSDINMPQMNGIEMIEKIKSTDETKHLPIIVVSTEGSAHVVDNLMNMGIREYLRKPFTPETVRDALKKVLGDWA